MLEIMKAYTLGYQTAKKGKEMKTCRNIKLNNIMKWSNLDERREIESEYRQVQTIRSESFQNGGTHLTKTICPA